MGAPLRLGLSSLALAATLSAACGSDDGDSGPANPDCARFGDSCTRCSCQVCPCDGECERGLMVYADCVDGCFALTDGEAVRDCMNGCENAATGSTRANLSCAASAVGGVCQSACRQ